MDIVTAGANIGYFLIQKELDKKNQKIEDREKNLEGLTEKISEVKETDSRAISEYNPNGQFREDYDTKKHLDIIA